MNPPTDVEFAKFTGAMREIVKVSKTELNRRIEAEKAEKRKTKSPASRASGVSPKRAT